MKVRKELVKSEASKFLTACSTTNLSSTVGIKQIVAIYSTDGYLLCIQSGLAFLSCGASVEAMYQTLPPKIRQRVGFACVYYRSSSTPAIPFLGSFSWCEVGLFRGYSYLVPCHFYDREHFLWKFKTFWELGQIQVPVYKPYNK